MSRSKLFWVYLAFLSVLGFLATDMYLPAFEKMQYSLNVSKESILMSLSIYLAGFAFAQLFWGLLSDSIGRKKALLLGLGLASVGCLGIIYAQTTSWLLVFRFIQAVGICSAAVNWQALLIDYYPAKDVNSVLASIMPLVALSPALAPLIGSLILSYADWRMIFVVILIMTLILTIATSCLPKAEKKQVTAEKQTKGFLHILSSAYYDGNVMIYSACSSCFFAWLTASPYILKDFGLSESEIGLSYVPQTIAFLIGGYFCRYLLSRISGRNLLPYLLSLYALSVITFFLLTIIGGASFIRLMVPFCIIALMNGAIYPIVVGNALKEFPSMSGRVAALQNTIQLGGCFIASQIVSSFTKNLLMTTSIVMLSTVVLVIMGYYLQHKGSRTAVADI